MVKIELKGKLTSLDSDQHLWLTFLVNHFDQEWMLLRNNHKEGLLSSFWDITRQLCEYLSF